MIISHYKPIEIIKFHYIAFQTKFKSNPIQSNSQSQNLLQQTTDNMQIQKHLFRISQRALRNPNASCFCNVMQILSQLLIVYYATVFIIGTGYVLPDNMDISLCFNASILQTGNAFRLQEDAIYQVYSRQINPIVLLEAKKNEMVMADNEHCQIIKGLDSKGSTDKPFEFTYTSLVLYLDTKQRETFSFTNYTIVLKRIPTGRYFFYGMSTLLANELLRNPLSIFPSTPPYTKSQYINIYSPVPPQLTSIQKILRVLKSTMYYIITSIVTSLYIYGTIIAAPAVIIIFLRCSQFVNNGGNMSDVYKIFPWIGIHSLIRETSQRQQIKKSSKEICWAIIFYFFFLYFVYYAVILKLSDDIFYQKTQQGLEEMMFGFVAMIEFCAITFMRTRPFIKFYPIIHTLLMVMFLTYCQFVTFGLKRNCLMIACTASIAMFIKMVVEFQIPAQTTWDRTKKYTPTVDRPRIGFLPLFNLNWINNLPDQWTMLFPLFGRESFEERELAFADRNFEMLDEVLGVNQPQAQLQENN